MKRGEFLKKLGIGIGVAIVAPRVIEAMPAKEKIIYPKLEDGVTIDTDLLPIKESALNTEDIMRIWQQSGQLLYIEDTVHHKINDVFTDGIDTWIGVCIEDGRLLCRKA